MRRVVTAEEKDGMVQLYISGYSARGAAARFGLSSECCTREAKKRGIPIKGVTKYSVDDSVFEAVDTEEKAYWLGFIVADGNITKDVVSINLKASDEHHLRKFLVFCKSNSPILTKTPVLDGKVFDQRRINICNRKIVSDLKNLGVIENKTFQYQCEIGFIPDTLKSHFWRGVFGGDGCISTTKNSKKNGSENRSSHWMINLINNERVIREFADFVRDNTKITAKVRQSKNNEKTFTFSAAGVENIQFLLRILYDDASVYLERKHELYEECLNTKIKRKNRESLSAETINSLLIKNKSWRNVAKELGTSTGRLYLIRKRLGMII